MGNWYTEQISEALEELVELDLWGEKVNSSFYVDVLNTVQRKLDEVKPKEEFYEVRLSCGFYGHSPEEAVVKFMEWMNSYPEDFVYEAKLESETEWSEIYGEDIRKNRSE